MVASRIGMMLAAMTTLMSSAAALDQQLYGVNYDLRQGPDWDPSKCKDASTIAADLKTLSTITKNVRTYSLADCNVAPVLTAAKSEGMTVWLGVWVSEDEKVYDAEVDALETLLKNGLIDSNVVGFNVGSEAVYRKDITAETAIKYLKQFKKVLKAKSIDIPVAITDIGDVLMQYPELMEESDVVTFNAFPFWEKIDASKAAAHFKRRVQPLLKMAGDKPVYITETGWASGGINVNASDAGPEEAARYLKDFHALAKEEGWKYYYFAAYDTPYKQQQEDDEDHVEGHFGLFTVDRKLKPVYAALKLDGTSPTDESSTESSSTDGSATASNSSPGTDTSTDSDTSTGTSSSGTAIGSPESETDETDGTNATVGPAGSNNADGSQAETPDSFSSRAVSGLSAVMCAAAALVLNL